MPGLTTNPNLGIGLGYDGRQDLGYGKNGNSGLGSQWAVTGNAGIYKEKSQYEKELDQDKLEELLQITEQEMTFWNNMNLSPTYMFEEFDIVDEYCLESKLDYEDS